WGPRGILASGLLDPALRLSLTASVLRLGYHTALEFTAALPLAAWGLLTLARNATGRRLVPGLARSLVVFVVFGVTHCSNWFFRPMFPLVAIAAGAGAGRARERLGAAPSLILVSALLMGEAYASYRALSGQFQEQEDFRRVVAEVEARRATGSRVLANWDHGLLFDHYTGRSPYSGEWVEVRDGRREVSEVVASGVELWGIDQEGRSALADLTGVVAVQLAGREGVVRPGGLQERLN